MTLSAEIAAGSSNGSNPKKKASNEKKFDAKIKH